MIIVIRKGTISIHAPRAGRDEGHLDPAQLEEIFQSTHPSRGATADKVTERLRHEISIHAPHAGRDNSTGDVYDNCEISIHAPHAGRDVILNPIPQEVALFQSTRPVRARPYLHQKLNYSSLISIHAPRAGATQAWFSQTTANNLFQSTRPVRGATQQR